MKDEDLRLKQQQQQTKQKRHDYHAQILSIEDLRLKKQLYSHDQI